MLNGLWLAPITQKDDIRNINTMTNVMTPYRQQFIDCDRYDH